VLVTNSSDIEGLNETSSDSNQTSWQSTEFHEEFDYYEIIFVPVS